MLADLAATQPAAFAKVAAQAKAALPPPTATMPDSEPSLARRAGSAASSACLTRHDRSASTRSRASRGSPPCHAPTSRRSHDEFLGRKSGSVTALLKTLGTLPPEARREFGALVNALKTEIEAALDEQRAGARGRRGRPPAPSTSRCPAAQLPLGRIHPLMRVRQQVEDIFTRMGYEILEGPEVEDDFHNFEALNMPPDHPARDMQDTLYLGVPIVGGTWGAHTGATAARTRRSARRRCCARTRRRCRSAT